MTEISVVKTIRSVEWGVLVHHSPVLIYETNPFPVSIICVSSNRIAHNDPHALRNKQERLYVLLERYTESGQAGS